MEKTSFEKLEEEYFGASGTPSREEHEKEFWQHMLTEERKYERKSQLFYLYAIISVVVTLLLQLIEAIIFRHSKILVYAGVILYIGSVVLLITFIRHMRKRPS